MKESERGQEQLYICDHANASCVCDMGIDGPCGDMADWTGKCSVHGDVKMIPYTEPKEEEKEEVKTKKVAVIAFLDIPDEPRNNPFVRIVYKTDQGASQDYKDFPVEEIDIDRLRYGCPKKGEMFVGAVRGWIVECQGNPNTATRLIIDPPTPEPEAVEDIFNEILNAKGPIPKSIMENLIERLIEAKERQECP